MDGRFVTPRLKALARTVLPGRLVTTISAVRARRHSHALNEAWGVRALGERVTAGLGFKVLRGPFAGLTLPGSAIGDRKSVV